MQFRRSNETRAVDREYHTQRQRARETAFNSDLSFFSDTERVKYDLDTAQIDGSDNPLTWTWDRHIDLFGTNGTDVRNLKDR
jgi:hypothetical protein